MRTPRRTGEATRTRAAWRVAIATTVLLVAGCGDDGVATTDDMAAGTAADVAASADDVTPEEDTGAAGCALVADDEVEATTGLTVLGHEDFGGGCTWFVEGVDEDVVDPAISWQPWSVANYDAQKQADQAGMDVGDVPGVGDEAFWVGSANDGNAYGEVWVRVGDRAFRITNQFSTPGHAGAMDLQVALAREVADALD